MAEPIQNDQSFSRSKQTSSIKSPGTKSVVKDTGEVSSVEKQLKTSAEAGQIQKPVGAGSILREMGLKNDALNRMIVDMFISGKIHFTRSSIQRLKSVFEAFPELMTQSGDEVSRQVLYGRILRIYEVLARGIPFNESLVSGMEAELEGLLLADQLIEMGKSLSEILGEGIKESEEGLFLRKLTFELAKIFIDSARVDATVVKARLESSGMFFEHKLLEWFQKGGSTENLLRIAMSDLAGILSQIRLNLEKILSRGVENETDIQKVLDQVSRTQGLLKYLKVNSLPVLDSSRERVIFFQIPVQFGKDTSTMNLRIQGRKKKAGEPVDIDNLRITIRLNPPHLGETELDLWIVEGRGNVTLRMKDTKALDFVKGASGELSEGLKKTGINVSRVTFSEKLSDDIMFERVSPESTSVDVRW